MYSLTIRESGMREPHWHPVTAEMGYVHRGHGRMTVLDPDGSLDTYLLEPGQVYFVPRAYPHHIEVLGDEDINFLIFFDQPTPGDIGYRATLPRSHAAFSRPRSAFRSGSCRTSLSLRSIRSSSRGSIRSTASTDRQGRPSWPPRSP